MLHSDRLQSIKLLDPPLGVAIQELTERPEDKEFISECVDRLFQGESLDREDLEHMATLFQAKWGRRAFAESLNQARVKENIGIDQSCHLLDLRSILLTAKHSTSGRSVL